MISRKARERLAQDVSLWQVDGLVTPEAAAVLRERYDARAFGLGVVVKYLGIMGAIVTGFGLLGAVAAISGSPFVRTIELFGVAAAFLWWGLKLARDPLGRAEQSSRAVLAIGLFALGAAGVAAADMANVDTGATLMITGAVTVPTAFVLAYRFRNGFLLVMALLGLFHWIGSWHSMMGSSTYAFDVQDPRIMSVASALSVGMGLLLRRGKIPGPTRFDTVWISVGLIYLNLSLLILTVARERTEALVWILVWTAAALAQVAGGAWQKSAVMTGFGVTALGLNLFTRYGEHFWNVLAKGLFFLVGGALLFGFGAAFEWLSPRLAGSKATGRDRSSSLSSKEVEP